jgi:hypothetical protein
MDYGTVYITVQSPNQIKDIDNLNPTEKDDIRYKINNKELNDGEKNQRVTEDKESSGLNGQTNNGNMESIDGRTVRKSISTSVGGNGLSTTTTGNVQQGNRATVGLPTEKISERENGDSVRVREVSDGTSTGIQAVRDRIREDRRKINEQVSQAFRSRGNSRRAVVSRLGRFLNTNELYSKQNVGDKVLKIVDIAQLPEPLQNLYNELSKLKAKDGTPIKVYFYVNDSEQAKNGSSSIKDNYIAIRLDSSAPNTALHELSHQFKELGSKAYETLSEEIRKYISNDIAQVTNPEQLVIRRRKCPKCGVYRYSIEILDQPIKVNKMMRNTLKHKYKKD